MRVEKLCMEGARCSLLVKALDQCQQITGAGAAGESHSGASPGPLVHGSWGLPGTLDFREIPRDYVGGQ